MRRRLFHGSIVYDGGTQNPPRHCPFMYVQGVPSGFGRHFPRLQGAHSVQRSNRQDFFRPLTGSEPTSARALAKLAPTRRLRETTVAHTWSTRSDRGILIDWNLRFITCDHSCSCSPPLKR